MRRFAAVLFLSAAATAQSQLDWLAAHDGPQSQSDFGRVCAVDALGDVYVAGRSYNPSVGFPPMPPEADFELVKYSSAGAFLWRARYDSFGSEDFVLDCQVSPTGDVYVSGYGWNASDIDAVLLKYTSAGALEWVRGHASAGGTDFMRAIAFDAAGNVLVCGNAHSATTGTDVLLESYTPAGALNWSTSFDGGASGSDSANALVVLASGQIALAGQVTRAGTGGDLAVWIVSANGVVQQSAALDGGFSATDLGVAICAAGVGKVAAAGSRTNASNTDWLVAQVDVASGAVDWSATFAGTGGGNENVRSLAFDADGVLWAAGPATNAATGIDFTTRRYAANGALLSSATWNNASANLDDSPYKVLLGAAGQAWVCGVTTQASSPLDADAAVVQYDGTGAFNWAAAYSSAGAFDDRLTDMELAPLGRIAMGGYTSGGASGDYDYLALQVDVNDSPLAYCTAKTTSNGCVPRIGFAGMPSASSASGFVVSCAESRNQKNGLLFYGTSGAQAAPFQGGIKCVASPQARSPLQSSGGNASPADDCSGAYALDMNAFAAGALGGTPLPALQSAGTRVHCQFWGRDPGFPTAQATMLSNALTYVVLP